MQTRVRQASLTWMLLPCGLLVIVACRAPTPPGSVAPTRARPEPVAVNGPSAQVTQPPVALARSIQAPTGPVTITLTLDEAESVVASWFIPDNEATIERSFYLATEDACAAWAVSRESSWLIDGVGSVDWCADRPVRPRTRTGTSAATTDFYEVRADAYVVVEAAFRGIDLTYPGLETPTELTLCDPVSSDTRVHFTALFDATTAEYLGYRSLVGPTSDDWSRWYRAVAARADDWRDRFVLAPRAQGAGSPIDATAIAHAATRTAVAAKNPAAPRATMSPREGSEPALALEVGEVPAALVGVARVVPLVPGAWWRYRVTGVENGVHWWRTTYTETIATGTQLAPDLMAVRLRSDTATGGPEWLGPWGGFTSVRLLVPDGVLERSGEVEPETSPDRWRSLSPDEGGPHYTLRLPLRVGEQYNYWWGSDSVSGVSVSAGEFRECTVMMEQVGNNPPNAHWLCPGIGYVRHEASGCRTFFGRWTVYELEDYFVPRVTMVP